MVSVPEIIKVSIQHYVAEDSECPIQSLGEFSVVRSLSHSSLSVTSLSDPLAQYRRAICEYKAISLSYQAQSKA